MKDLKGVYSIISHPTMETFNPYLVVGVGIELVGDDDVDGEQQLDLLLQGHGLELLGQVELVSLDHGVADRQAAGLVEGEDHASSAGAR